MGGGLMQLVAYGAQDIYLTGQPQITFFKSVYRRHTNFAVESIQQTFSGQPNPGQRVSVTVSRNGDLLKNLWVQYNPADVVKNTVYNGEDNYAVGCDFGHALFEQLELEIGGQLIDRQYGKWLTIWRQLTEVNPTGSQGRLHWYGKEPPYGNNEQFFQDDLSTLYQKMSYTNKGYNGVIGDLRRAPIRAYVPMCFWFCRNPGLAIPLIALQYHEVKFNIVFASADKFVKVKDNAGTSTVSLSSVTVYADYVYLDTTERRQFAQNAHEYLIDQVQIQNESGTMDSIRLNFNHPVKELIFTGTPRPVDEDTTVYGYSGNVIVTGGATPYAIASDNAPSPADPEEWRQLPNLDISAKLVLNGTDRFTERHLTYFTRNQIWDAHTGYGSTGLLDAIGVYSFALRPEEHQPSGTCNFSRIDNAQLKFLGADKAKLSSSLDIYAVNYNVLRIMSGMGGLAYSN